MRSIFLKCVSIFIGASCSLTAVAQQKAWNEAYSKESPLDVAVSGMIEEINSPSSRPPFASLRKIYSSAVTSVPAIRKTAAQINGLRYGVEEKEAKLNPTVTLQTNFGQSAADTANGKASDNVRATNLIAEQLLFDFGATTTEIAIAKMRLAAGVERSSADRLSVLLSMVTAQLELQAARKMVVFYDAYEKSRQQFFDLIQEKVSLGASSQLDLVRARTKLLEAKANIPSISAELFRAESRVQEFFSAVPDFAFAFYRLPDIPINFGGNIDELVSRHPAILEAAQNVALVRKEMEFLRNASFGKLSFKLSVTDTKQPVVGHSNTSSGFIEYSNTLFDGFSRRARIATLGERVVELQVEQERIERKLRQQLLATLSEFQSAKDTLEVREQLLLSARKSAKDQYTAFLLNRGSLTDIFDAEESYFTAAESTLDAIANLHRAYYKTLYDAGQLSDAFELNS